MMGFRPPGEEVVVPFPGAVEPEVSQRRVLSYLSDDYGLKMPRWLWLLLIVPWVLLLRRK